MTYTPIPPDEGERAKMAKKIELKGNKRGRERKECLQRTIKKFDKALKKLAE